MGFKFTHAKGFRIAFLLAGSVLLTGCQKGPDVQLVGGTVTLDGEPLRGATVIFAPRSDGGLAAIGKSDATGSFRLSARTSNRYGQGTVAGDYAVVVSKLEELEQPDTPDQPPERFIEPKELLPRVYTSEKTTPFRATVKPGTNEFTFELQSSGK